MQKSILHYVAVNARTKETRGSVPIHMPKLLGISCLVEILGLIVMAFLSDYKYNWLFAFAGFLYFIIIYMKYRNADARHHYKTETKTKLFNLRKVDNLIGR